MCGALPSSSCRPRRRAASSRSLFTGQEDGSANSSPCGSSSGAALRSKSATPGWRAGASAKRRQTDSHAPSRRPSRSAATLSPSFSGSNSRSAMHRDANARQRPASQPERTASGSLIHANTSLTGSSEKSRSKSTASRRRPRSACTGVAASSCKARSRDCRVARIARDVQPEAAAVPGCEERLHRPVPAVSLRPADPPVLELDQRFQTVRAGVGGAELLAARAGQVDDGGRIGGKPGRRQRPVDHAPQPDRRAGAFLGIVFAEHQKLRQDGAEPRHGGAPPGIAVGPQDGGGRLRVVGVAGGGGFERGGQGLDDGGGRRRRVHHPDPPMRYGRARPPAITASGAVGAPPIRACSTIMSGRSAPASAPHRGSGRNPS